MTKNKYDFEDKVVLITGSGSGIGQEVAREFLENGAKVVLVGRRLEKLRETVEGYPPSDYLLFAKDIATKTWAEQTVKAALKKFGKIDIVVANAGTFEGAPIEEMTYEQWKKVMDINLNSNFFLAQAVYPELKKNKGNFIVTSSASGLGGDWEQYAYNASKFGVNGLVKCLALDWGKDGIRVNAVCPALTLTPLTKGMLDENEPDYKEKAKPYLNRVALGYIGTPKDIAPAYLFLASDDARYITGVLLPVDGGTTASNGQAHVE